MSVESLKRPSLGQVATLGMLYDARSDRFLPHSVIRGTLPGEAVNRLDVNQAYHTVTLNETYKDKFNQMSMSSELGASFLAGFVNVEGSGRYLLTPERDTALTVHRALHYTISTLQESLNFSSSDFRDLLTVDELPSNVFATHLVTEITWGARCIVAATQTLSSEDDRPKIEKALKSAFEKFESTEEWGFDAASTYPSQTRQEIDEITVYSDVLEHDELSTDLDDALTHFMNLPRFVTETSDSKGKPLAYTLFPISFFAMFFGVTIPATVSPGHVSAECQEKFVGLLDELRVSQKLLSDYCQRLNDYRICVRPSDIFHVADRLRSARKAESSLRSSYTRSLKDIRTGRGSSQNVWELVETFLQGDSAPRTLIAITNEYSERLSFVDLVGGKGAIYIGYDGPSRQEFSETERSNSWGDAYVFYFNDAMTKNTHSWKEHVDLLIEILGEKDHRERVFVVDCDVTGTPLKDLCIFRYQNDSLVTTNVLKQRRHLVDKCIMRYDPRYLDATVKDDPWPPKRKMVKIPCPGGGPNCNSSHDWIYFKCHVSIEYGTDDSYMYCECGRVQCRGSLYEFNCQRPGHTPNYAKYGDLILLSIMRELSPPPEVNILILGESGVGKSTFINAFINYLTFTSLDHALSATQLNWVIPCSFATSTVDKSTGRIVQRVVKICSDRDPDEVSGVKGKSATQKATAYPIYIGGKLIRLIDTPGIGDTRGIEQDKRNMVHTLSVLKNYRTLHGILILLKPQNARLGVMFKFCINELLTHLHRDAANNVVFGFTNTRGTMYTPGDAVGPLETQLENYKVLPGLYEHTVYCFDSESFRYLAARKQKEELDLGNIEDYRRSWDHSANESQRLMDYFGKRNPHFVDSTLGLAETRDLIIRLVEPMAEVIKVVTASIAKSKKDLQDLSTTKKKGAELKGSVNLTKTTLVSETLKDPYTVCDNQACVSRVPGPGGKNVVLRKSLCHDPCSLTEITPDERGANGITGCWAFINGICQRCSHTPGDHMHIRVLYSEKTETTIDPIVQAKLNANASDVQIKEAQMSALKRQIAEYQREQDLLEDAQAKFSYYLEENSITVYNDVTIEYLDHLIKDEKNKIGPGGVGRVDLIEALEKSKKKHREFVEAMRKGKQAQSSLVCQTLNERGVARLVTSLCAMKHFGTQLKDAANAVQGAYAAQFREKPFRVRGPEAFSRDIPASWRRNNGRSGPSQGSAGPSRNWKPIRSKQTPEIAPLSPPLPSDPSKRALQNGHAQSQINSSAEPAPPPPYEPSAPASVPNQYQPQPQSPPRLRKFKNFLRAKLSSRSP